jgi:ABC-type Na+ efflux pump permease subunit
MSVVMKKNKKLLLTCIVVTTLVIGGVSFLILNRKESTSKEVAPAGSVNLSGPTEQEKEDAEANKNIIVEREKAIQQAANAPSSSVKPVITYAGQYSDKIEVGGYVNVFEDGGICEATFTHGNDNITRKVTAIKNVNSVDCPTISLGTSEFTPKGDWSVIISYTSPNYQGKSDTKNINVK